MKPSSKEIAEAVELNRRRTKGLQEANIKPPESGTFGKGIPDKPPKEKKKAKSD